MLYIISSIFIRYNITDDTKNDCFKKMYIIYIIVYRIPYIVEMYIYIYIYIKYEIYIFQKNIIFVDASNIYRGRYIYYDTIIITNAISNTRNMSNVYCLYDMQYFIFKFVFVIISIYTISI